MDTSNDDGAYRDVTEAAINCLLNGIWTFGDNVDQVFKHVFAAASGFVGRSGKEEVVVVYLEKVVEFIEETDDLAGTLLHCHILYRVAQVLSRQKHMEKAKQYFYSAQKFAAAKRPDAEFIKREFGIWEHLICIHDVLGEKKQLRHAREEYVLICESILREPLGWVSENRGRILVEVARAIFEIGMTDLDEKEVKRGIGYLDEALHLAKDRKSETSDSGALQAWILLQLSEFNYVTDTKIAQCEGRCASWKYLEQAIAGLQQAECTCSSGSSSSWDGIGMVDCAHHQLLADAYLFQGRFLQNHGFMVEAQKSFEAGLNLVEQCNDRKREAWFHLELAHHLFLESHMYTNSCLHIKDSPQYTKTLLEQVVGHYRDFVENYTPGVVFVHDQMVLFARDFLRAAEDPNVTSSSAGFNEDGFYEAILKHLKRAAERDDYEAHAVYHECLSVHYYRIDDEKASEKHVDLAMKYMEMAPPKSTPLRAFQTLGWISMSPKFSILQETYWRWVNVYKEALELQELMIKAGLEDQALRYLELNKRACMALAKCQILLDRKSVTCPDSPKPLESCTDKSLVWAERGSGRMLMALIKAITGDSDVGMDILSTSQFDSRGFLLDYAYAISFMYNMPRASGLLSRSSKTVFIKFSFLSHHELLTHLVVDDPSSDRPVVQYISEGSCLHCELPEGIRRQAESYLEESIQDRSEATQSSIDTGAVGKLLSVMNKYSSKTKSSNLWFLGMIVGIHKHVGQATKKLEDDPDAECANEKRAITELLQILFKVLIKPIKKKLDDVYITGDTLVFVPHEDLGMVPFGALHESDGSRHLIEDYAISVSPSLWCTRHCQHLYEKAVGRGAGPPVLVGKKSGYPPGWPPLKEAHEEVDAVAEAMRSITASKVLKDTSPDELSQARLLKELPTASWVHLSMHGEVSSQFPQGSLLFSDNNHQRLTVEKILTLAPVDLRVRAVVASACQTGLGAVAGGGILGFAMAFILAGVPSSVLAMWEARAKFCTEFMTKLYEQLALGYSLAHAMQKVVILIMHEPKRIPKDDRKGKGKVGKDKDGELKWRILDWACLSCFGFPGVTLPMVELVLPKGAEPGLEDGTACSRHENIGVAEKSVEPCVVPGCEDMNQDLVNTDAVQGLLHGVKTFGIENVAEIFKHVFKIASNIAERSGSVEESVVIYLEKVLEHIKHNPQLADSLLYFHFVSRIARAFTFLKHMDKAKLHYYNALAISADRRSELLLFLIRETGIWENLISIHDTLGEEKESLDARKEYVRSCKPLLEIPDYWPSRVFYKRTLVKVGQACFDVGRICNDTKQLEDGIDYLTEALKVEVENTSEQGMILMQLSKFHYDANPDDNMYTSLIKQAIAALQKAKCSCSSNSSKGSLASSLFAKPGMDVGCGFHLLLPDAYVVQGNFLIQQGQLESANQSFYSGSKIVADRSDMECLKRAFSIWENIMSIHDQLGQKELLLRAQRKFVKICELLLLSPPAWLKGELRSILVKVGRVCFEIGKAQNELERIEDGINHLTEALQVEGNKLTETSEQAWILKQLSEFHCHTNSESSVYANWILLEQATAAYQQVECTCNGKRSDNSLLKGVPEMSDCGPHQLLADAYVCLGLVQQDTGFLEEARKNFERSLELVEKCNDKARQTWVSILLYHHSIVMKPHMHTNACYHRVHDNDPLFNDFPDNQDVFSQTKEFFMRNFCRPDAAFHFDQLTVLCRAISIVRNDPEALSDPNGFKVAMIRSYKKQLQLAEERGDYDYHAVYHECLSIYYHRIEDLEACKNHYYLTLEYLDKLPSKTILLRVLLSLGWLAFIPNISDFQGAYFLWELVFNETVRLQDTFAAISEDHALRYFEHSKYACAALAKCQMKRAHASQTRPEAFQSYVESALVWAERGKGRMLMSFIEASIKTTDDPASQIFDTRRFFTDDSFPFKFIGLNTTRPSPLLLQSRKTIYVEYTYIDRSDLMIHVVVEDPITGGIFVLVACVVCLDCELPERIKCQAEEYFNESFQHRPESSTGSLFSGTPFQSLVAAMKRYSTIYGGAYYNRYIPGMVVGIQKHVGKAIETLKNQKSARCMNEKRAITELLQILFKVLIKPIKKKLDDVYITGDTLVFVPHEDLGMVPFGALHESDGSRHLIEDYAISVSPSLWCTRHCQHLYEKTARHGCDEGAGSIPPVLVGKKSGYPPGFLSLKEAHKEVDAVAEAMRSVTASTVLKDTSPDELSQARLLKELPTASWVHLSMHGEVSFQFPQGSLLLSDDSGQRLTAEQIITLAPSGWRARAVVASACQTGLGAVAGGGILGFARAFILAGVPSSMLAMWEAPAKFCTEFMKRLYEQLALGYSLAHATQKVVIFMMHKKVQKGERTGQYQWTILDWACFSCFGLPGVTLPNVEQLIAST